MKTIYDEYKNTNAWKIINKSIANLVKNNDVEELTQRDYIVGYIVKNIIENKSEFFTDK
jgi:hypothetical protein